MNYTRSYSALDDERMIADAEERPRSLLNDYLPDGVALTILSGAILSQFLVNENFTFEESPQSSKVFLFSYFLVYVYVGIKLFLSIETRRELISMLREQWRFWLPIVLLLALAFASFAWSAEPLVSLRRSVAVSGTVLTGLYLGVRYSSRQLFLLIAMTAGVLGVTSALAVIFWPVKGVMQISELYSSGHVGRWRGVFIHKNGLGAFMAMGAMAAAFAIASSRRRLVGVWLVLVLCTYLVIRAESLTALLSLMVGLSVALTFRLCPLARPTRKILLISASPLLILLVVFGLQTAWERLPEAVDTSSTAHKMPENIGVLSPSMLGGFEREKNLTGRTRIWAASWTSIAERPLTGYGFRAFWRLGGPAEIVWDKIQWHSPNAHNGWLDVVLWLGIPAGLLLSGWVVWLGVILLISSWRAPPIGTGAEPIGLLGLLAFLILFNVTESHLLRPNDFYWAVFIALAASICRVRSLKVRLEKATHYRK